jgi:hypothetical protein
MKMTASGCCARLGDRVTRSTAGALEMLLTEMIFWDEIEILGRGKGEESSRNSRLKLS